MTDHAQGRDRTHSYDLIVVGGGPRALYALADLDTALAREGATRGEPLRIAVVEPYVPGAGAVWDADQPTHLLMNVDAGIVDARCPAVPQSFREWSGEADPFPPRARVGAYLGWAFDRLCESPRLNVTHIKASVTSVQRDGARWRCVAGEAAGVGAGGVDITSPTVLMATGHAGGAGLDHVAMSAPQTGPTAGAPLLVRGAALTAFDVVLDVTQGRGGTWHEDSGTPSRLRYVPSGREPSLVTLVARSGEEMLPKPARVPLSVAGAVRDVTAGLEPQSAPDDAWWDVLARAAVAGAAAAGVTVTPAHLWARLDGPAPRATRGERDLARAHGELDEDAAWWWGRAWAAGYADVVRSLERAPRDQHTWTRWRRRAATLERWAFGPPVQTYRRLLALREAGLLTVEHGRGDAGRGAGTHDGPRATTIDAFTCGPGVLAAPRSWDAGHAWIEHARTPWRGLARAGHVMVRPGERGVLTLPDGQCVAADGSSTPGLYALGRPTEDVVVGHDSLQRRLHDDSRRWAATIARAQRRSDAHDEPVKEPQP
ncbi:FAD/NAD(P)-binding protein [Demequina globuliformis]|uniref:FAD/NAD(P)-binding protein n=1 Tax=Demequina globuliformis TaxID=676202 RepID=UPI0007813FDE|nr:FAD/NAD(P)-binding domain-containing protein [Demequina globuliformis]